MAVKAPHTPHNPRLMLSVERICTATPHLHASIILMLELPYSGHRRIRIRPVKPRGEPRQEGAVRVERDPALSSGHVCDQWHRDAGSPEQRNVPVHQLETGAEGLVDLEQENSSRSSWVRVATYGTKVLYGFFINLKYCTNGEAASMSSSFLFRRIRSLKMVSMRLLMVDGTCAMLTLSLLCLCWSSGGEWY